MRDVLLVPVADALPVFQAHCERWAEDGQPPSEAELEEFAWMYLRFERASQRLLRYAVACAGRPSRN